MKKILFLCLGNICRSPMAEAVFRHMVKANGKELEYEIDSAGLGGWHQGNPPHIGTQKILEKYNIPYTGIIARQFTKEDFNHFDLILAMDEENIEGLKNFKEFDPNKVRLFLQYSQQINNKNVPDPYYTGRFEEVYQLVNQGCIDLLKEIDFSSPFKH